MDIKMFFEFPGVLITIGVFFLVISIVIGIIAYKNPVNDEEEIENIKSKLKDKEEKLEENNNFVIEENFLDKEVIEDNETKLELVKEKEPTTNELKEELEETNILDTSLIKEQNEELNVNEQLEKTENLDDVKDEIMSLLNDIDNQEQNEELNALEQSKEIYGGANPSANINFDTNFKEKVPYEEKTIDLDTTEDLINTLNKEIVKNEEDIEIL